VTHIPSGSEYRTRLATEFAAGNPPDVTLMNYRRYAAFAANDLLEPLGPYLANSELIQPEDFYPITIDAFTWDGVITCIPQNISSLVVYYNQDLFDAAGVAYPTADWTWDDFVKTAVALTKDTNGDGTIDQYGAGIEPHSTGWPPLSGKMADPSSTAMNSHPAHHYPATGTGSAAMVCRFAPGARRGAGS
jgi:multiple sugar transport system substrate-binding protein